VTASSDRHVVLYDLGSASADLIQALCKAGVKTTVVEQDPDDATRVREILGRRLADATVPVATSVGPACSVFLCRSVDASKAPEGALVVVLDGPHELAAVPDQTRSVAMDLFDPRLVEIDLGSASADRQAEAVAFAKLLGVPVLQSTGHAFAGTVLQDAALALVDRLLLVGVTPWELDEALEDAGFTEGLLKAQDHIGLEVAFARRRMAGTDLLVADRMVREGRLGRSIGVGWYRYPGGGGAVIDPLMEDMIVEEARFARIAELDISPQDAAGALILGVINAASSLLQEGVSLEELDQLAFYKLGLPQITARARAIGYTALVQRLKALERIDIGLWGASPCLPRIFAA
jgi:3-hydroxyacyl-CoA dehydrogenase